MPYYCTVPRCTSMAGKAKDVSFHQFPKDKRLADIWNEVLKRGKPYTKYSKVCSLHFTLADYTAGSLGKHKGHWRTLRKDAIPSQNLPSESPVPTHRGRSSSSNSSWPASTSATPVLEIEVGQHIAHAIYVQTMLALQNAGDGVRATSPSVDGDITQSDTMSDTEMRDDIEGPRDSQSKILEKLLSKRHKRNQEFESIHDTDSENIPSPVDDNRTSSNSYRCDECSKCFKDPDVYLLHKRTHKTKAESIERLQENEKEKEKENFNVNKEKSEDTLKANPILVNLLKTNTNNMQGVAVKCVTVLKTAPCNANGDRYPNGSESDNSGVDSERDDSVEDSSENLIVKSEISIEEHDVMDQISAVKAEKHFENDENTNKSIEEVKNAIENPIDQLFIVKNEKYFDNDENTNRSLEDIKNAFENPIDQLFIDKKDPLADDEAAELNSEHPKVIPKSDIKVEHNSIKVEDELITVEDLMDS